MTVPKDQWDGILRAEPHPLALYFAVSRGGIDRKPYFTFDFKLDGASAKELAKALAFFFCMDDYGRMLYKKIQKNAQTYIKGVEKMERLWYSNQYPEWKEDHQKMFIKFIQEIEEYEKDRVDAQDDYFDD